MDGPWPHEAVARDIRTIMGTERGDQEPPLERIAQCREHLGGAIVSRLKLITPDPRHLDRLIELVLHAALDAGGTEDPQILAARELLGFSLLTRAEIEKILKNPPEGVSNRSGFQSKTVRLYLAGRHQSPPIEVRATHNHQKEWALAAEKRLFEFLHHRKTLAEASQIAADLFLEFLPGAQPEDVDQQALASSDADGKVHAPVAVATLAQDGFMAFLANLSGEVEQALDAARRHCEVRKRAYYTFDTLTALLDMPSGRALSCFNEPPLNWGSRVRQGLAAMPNPRKPAGEFTPINLNRLPEVKQAWKHALSRGDTVIHDLDLLLAIFTGSSETNKWLKELLGEDYARVRTAVEHAQRGGPENLLSPT